MTGFEEIRKIVSGFQKKADGYFRDYNAKMNRARERYSEKEFMLQSATIWGDASGKMKAEREIAIDKISEIEKDIQEDFRRWMIKPLDNNLLQTMNYIRNFELKMSIDELEVLKDSVQDSFFGLRILGEVAKNSGYFFDVPKMGDFTRKLHTAVSNAKDAVECYSGSAPEFPGKDLLGEWTVSGISQGEYPVWRRLGAADYLEKDTSAKEAEEAWNASKIPLEFKVTKKEKERISKMIGNPASEEEKRERIRQLADADPDIINKIKTFDDFSESILRYVDTGNFREKTE